MFEVTQSIVEYVFKESAQWDPVALAWHQNYSRKTQLSMRKAGTARQHAPSALHCVAHSRLSIKTTILCMFLIAFSVSVSSQF